MNERSREARSMRWRYFAIRLSIWLVSEVYLSFVGVDNLADYGEFVFNPALIEVAAIVRMI